VSNKVKNIFQDKNFNFVASQISEVFEAALESFWEQDVEVILQAVNDYREIREEKLISNIDFFSSQIKVDNHKPIIIRLSGEFVEETLALSLGQNLKRFKFSEITPLEIKILNAFCEFVYKRLKEVLIPTSVVKVSEKSEKNFNFLFLIKAKDECCSKIMISIPQDRIKLESLKKQDTFKEEDFLTSRTTVNLCAGSSKITFDELQNLAKDDIIVLENSELNKMTLISGEIRNKFNIKINPSLIVDLNNEDEEQDEQIYEEVTMGKNLWDDIQIEINAEFEKVKMTIGELKQITQGQIVDLGSVFDNEISLFVEDRKVAKGELIIINDRYAVRLNEILNSPEQKAINAEVNIGPKPEIQPQAKPQAQAQAKPQAQQQKAPLPPPQRPQAKRPQVVTEDEEFDYSDFEK